ncbi:MAG: hypothetical protein R3B09_02175 [Nannocystaceae bacterium]
MARPTATVDPAHLQALSATPRARPPQEVIGYLIAMVSAPSRDDLTAQIEALVGPLNALSADQAKAVVEALHKAREVVLGALSGDASVVPPSDVDEAIAWTRGYVEAAERDPIWRSDEAALRIIAVVDNARYELMRRWRPDQFSRDDHSAMMDAEPEDLSDVRSLLTEVGDYVRLGFRYWQAERARGR